MIYTALFLICQTLLPGDSASQEATPKRAVRDDADAQLPAHGHYVALRTRGTSSVLGDSSREKLRSRCKTGCDMGSGLVLNGFMTRHRALMAAEPGKTVRRNAQHSIQLYTSASLDHSDHSSWYALMGWTACALRKSAALTSLTPKYFTLPSFTSSCKKPLSRRLALVPSSLRLPHIHLLLTLVNTTAHCAGSSGLCSCKHDAWETTLTAFELQCRWHLSSWHERSSLQHTLI